MRLRVEQRRVALIARDGVTLHLEQALGDAVGGAHLIRVLSLVVSRGTGCAFPRPTPGSRGYLGVDGAGGRRDEERAGDRRPDHAGSPPSGGASIVSRRRILRR